MPYLIKHIGFSQFWGPQNFLWHLDVNFVQKFQKCQIYVIYETLNIHENIHFLQDLFVSFQTSFKSGSKDKRLPSSRYIEVLGQNKWLSHQ